jgi:hypothetical protein
MKRIAINWMNEIVMINYLRIFIGAFVMSTFISGCDHHTDFSNFDAVTVKRSGTFELDFSPDDAFPLFTAPGERLWATRWEPFILNGDGYEVGTIWVTEGYGFTDYWYVADYDTETRYAQYVRVTPRDTAATIDVSLTSNGKDGTNVHITYQLTALSEWGNERLAEQFSEDKYAEMMVHWQTLINANREKIDDHFGR